MVTISELPAAPPHFLRESCPNWRRPSNDDNGPAYCQCKVMVAMAPSDRPILEEALEIIHGQRQADYGPPEESFGRIAALWNAYLGDALTTPLGHHDVAMLMNLLKVSRAKNGIDTVGYPQRDSLVDAAGYMGCADLMPPQGDHHDG